MFTNCSYALCFTKWKFVEQWMSTLPKLVSGHKISSDSSTGQLLYRTVIGECWNSSKQGLLLTKPISSTPPPPTHRTLGSTLYAIKLPSSCESRRPPLVRLLSRYFFNAFYLQTWCTASNGSSKQNTGSSKKMDGIWNRYNLKSTGRIYTFGVLKCSEKFKVLDLP